MVPIENQVREFDAKLLLSCIAAKRGIPCIIGSKRELEAQIATFPRSVYLAKSLLHGHSKFLQIAVKLGHAVTAWDEDSLVHLPPEIYYSRRLSSASLACVSHLFAWGEDNAELWRQFPEMPVDMPIHVTGNPRNDLLRSEMQSYYQDDVRKIQEEYGNFILINTNFNHVNAFSPIRRLFIPPESPGDSPKPGRAARGMPLEYAEGLRDHKQAVFEQFQTMIPDLEKAFPDHTIIVRPHQVESQATYQQIAKQCKRVIVTNKGNVVPWLMACKAVILNGCTTSVEAYAMGVPAISYRVVVNDVYDLGFYRLPNLLSHQCFSFDELTTVLGKILAGDLGIPDGTEPKAIMAHHLKGYEGPFACERIVDVLEKVVESLAGSPKPSIKDRLSGWYKANKRNVRRRSKMRRKDANRSLAHHSKKNPEIPLEEVRSRAARFQQALNDSSPVTVTQIHSKLFRVTS